MTARWKTAWITGASTGIGRELALLLAARGVRVAVSARGADQLRELAGRARNILAVPVDVTDVTAVRQAHDRIRVELGPIGIGGERGMMVASLVPALGCTAGSSGAFGRSA